MSAPAFMDDPLTEACTCQSGRDHDGSEFGLCQYCERIADDVRLAAIYKRDAARWQVSQVRYLRLMDDPYGYFAISHEDGHVVVGIQPHPVTKSLTINHCILGRGPTEGDAIDRMFLALDGFAQDGHSLAPEIERPRALAEEARGERQ